MKENLAEDPPMALTLVADWVIHRLNIFSYSEYILNYTQTMSKLIEQVQSSELSRNPLKVFSAAEKTPVTVTRRDGEDLVIMSKRESQNLPEFHTFISQMLVALDDTRGSLVERLSKPFPWILAFDESGQQQCASELVKAAKVAMATNTPMVALTELYAWKGTAEVIALGIKFDDAGFTEQPILVERP